MVFSHPVFLFLFLPIVLALYVLSPRLLKNLALLLASLFFYAWGEQEIVAVMLGSIAANYGFGRWLERTRSRGGTGRGAVALSVTFNLALLVVFKYANWLWDNLSAGAVAAGLGELPGIPAIHLPIGISFFTFQAMSYVIDVYRRQGQVQRNPVDFALYIALFPQLIAGPIVRYRDVAAQIVKRKVSEAGFTEGVRRFTIGLGKKMLVANIVAVPADRIFALPTAELPVPVAWLGIVCYTLQIYFDFSGYSDMAIGLGRMFGFRFLENFEHPYISRSITEFWRRWHISLSSWFRDYLYIPLGGNRKGPARTLLNLVLVFALCGLWHGASWNFIAWGLFHGGFLVLERLELQFVPRRSTVLRHVYVLLTVMVGWVLFRAPDLTAAVAYLKAMTGLGALTSAEHHLALFVDPALVLVLVAGVIGSTPWLPRLRAFRRELVERAERPALARGLHLAGTLGIVLVLLVSAMELSANTYNPFIYFRF